MHIYPAGFLTDRRYVIDPELCFLLMPFERPWSSRVFATVRSTVEGFGYRCLRADEDRGSIVLRDIWDRINEAAFVVADLTGSNPNVYYELGLAHTVGTEVLPLIQAGEPIPFDQRSYRIVIYEDTDDGHERLSRDLGRRIRSLSFDSSPQLMIKNERVDQFNDWRQRGVPVRFGGEDFSELDLRAVDLKQSYLSETSFRFSTLDDASLREATLIRGDFTGASLQGADLTRANISEATFEGAQLQRAQLEGGIALRVELAGADMAGAEVGELRVDEATYARYQRIFAAARNPRQIIRER